MEAIQDISKEEKINRFHTPTENPNPKKKRGSGNQSVEDESTASAILKAVHALTVKMDEQTALLQNKLLCSLCEDQARYKRKWNLRLIGLPEKSEENVRETVIGLLTRVVPVSVDKLRDTVDTVHRLGVKGNAASSTIPRAVIIQFSLKTLRDEVWKKSKDARVCKEMNVRFREDFSKEEARTKLWPLVQEARRKGKRAFLKDGYALLDNKRVDPN
uniref:Uncharacterized protein n=1 Tax=Nothobranchius pienaari TaxID=704102 RepID=A0A1A8MRJ2_9TELE